MAYSSVLGLVPPPLWDSGSGYGEMPLERTAGLLNKANGAAFLRSTMAYQLQGQVYRLQMCKDFAIVVPTIRAIEYEETRGKVANFRHEDGLLARGVIVDF